MQSMSKFSGVTDIQNVPHGTKGLSDTVWLMVSVTSHMQIYNHLSLCNIIRIIMHALFIINLLNFIHF
jgi:hypothetical protein